jgi:hypothetical protein
MKRIISILLIVAILLTMAFTLTACGKATCEMCGQTEKLKSYNSYGTTRKLCDDCYRLAKFMDSL